MYIWFFLFLAEQERILGEIIEGWGKWVLSAVSTASVKLPIANPLQVNSIQNSAPCDAFLGWQISWRLYFWRSNRQASATGAPWSFRGFFLEIAVEYALYSGQPSYSIRSFIRATLWPRIHFKGIILKCIGILEPHEIRKYGLTKTILPSSQCSKHISVFTYNVFIITNEFHEFLLTRTYQSWTHFLCYKMSKMVKFAKF